MKSHFILTLCSLLVINRLSAQNDAAPPTIYESPATAEKPVFVEKVYEMFDIQKPPQFPGGEAEMMNYIYENLKYPALARENAIQGSVVLTFIVDKDGSVTNTKILRDIGGGCGKEAVRVVESMPKWQPGEANGLPVKVLYTLPFRFRLEGGRNQATPPPPPPNEARGTLAENDMWGVVSDFAQRTKLTPAKAERSSPFDGTQMREKTLMAYLEMTYKVKLSEADRNGFKTLGEVSDYFYKAQFAPELFTKEGMIGRSAKFLTDRADFDLNADGLGRIASFIVPEGAQLVLYSKKNFKGEKLLIQATDRMVDASQMSAIAEVKKSKYLKGNKKFNWETGTKSIKVMMPKK